MPDKHPLDGREKDKLKIVDTEAARTALAELISTVENTGGIVWNPHSGFQVPAADQEWSDLTDAYFAACRAVGRTPMEEPEDEPEPEPEPEEDD